MEDLDVFLTIISNIMDGEYSLKQGYLVNGEAGCAGLKFYALGNDIWRISPIDMGHLALQIHRNTLKNFTQITTLIRRHFDFYDPKSCQNFLNELKQNASEMVESEIFNYLYERLNVYNPGSMEYEMIADLICNRDSFMAHDHLSNGFYKKNTIIS